MARCIHCNNRNEFCAVCGTRIISDFEAVGSFHARFNLDRTQTVSVVRDISHEARHFRLKFLKEELREIEEGYEADDMAKVADGLVDLVYVALGTAHLHGFPWEVLFAEVQRANMTKMRALDHRFVGQFEEANCASCGNPKWKHSQRASALDVIKPPDFEPPNIESILKKYGWRNETCDTLNSNLPIKEVETNVSNPTSSAFCDYRATADPNIRICPAYAMDGSTYCAVHAVEARSSKRTHPDW